MERRSLTPSKAEFANWRAEIDEAMERCVRIGRVDLVTFWAKPESIALRIVQNREGASRHFLEAVPKTQMKVREIDEPDQPWEMVCETKELSLAQVGKELPTFLHFFYQQAEELPIYIYRSRTDFRMKKPAAISQFENGLVTVKTTA